MNIIITNNLIIGPKKRTLIIAEVSANHCGSKKKFLKHILLAKKSGADLVKIQSYEAEDMVVDKNFKIKKGLWKNNNLWDLYKKAQTPLRWHEEAFNLAKKNNIELFSTPFSLRSLEYLKKFNPKIYKISSFEISDLNLITEIAKLKKPIIISTGLSSLSEIKRAVDIIKKFHNKIIILYCVSSYPTKLEEFNFDKIKDIKRVTKINNVGFSDHSLGIEASVAAMSKGVSVIEKHFKLNNNIKSPDSIFSINPSQLKDLRNFSFSFNKIFNTFVESEKKNSLFFRRSIYAIKKIKKGEKLTKENIACFRPFAGICASKYFKLLGRKSKKMINKNSVLKESYF